MPDTYFISGAAGHLGRAVVNHLINTFEVAPANIIAGTRDASKVADLKAKGVQVRTSDFDDEAGLAKSLAGVTHFLIISTDASGSGAAPGTAPARGEGRRNSRRQACCLYVNAKA